MNTPVLQLFRNTSYFQTREEALADIAAKAITSRDGEMWLSTYGANDNVDTLLAVKRAQNGTYSVTVFDNVANQQAIEEALKTLDYSDSIRSKHFVSSVSQLDGQIAVTKGVLSSTDSTITIDDITTSDVIDGIDLKVNIDNSTLRSAPNGIIYAEGARSGQDAIKVSTDDHHNDTISLSINNNDKILSQSNDGLLAEVSLVSITPSSTNIKEEYKLVGKNNAQLGTTIKIYKDTSLVECYIGSDTDVVDAQTGVVTKYTYEKIDNPSVRITTADYNNLPISEQQLYQPISTQSLNFVYQIANGTYTIVKVDISKFLSETEFKDGLEVTDHVVKVKIDHNSESYLSVSEDGLKIAGINDMVGAEGDNNYVIASATDNVVHVQAYIEPLVISPSMGGDYRNIVVLYTYYDTSSHIQYAYTQAEYDALPGGAKELFTKNEIGDYVITDTSYNSLPNNEKPRYSNGEILIGENALVDGKDLADKVNSLVTTNIFQSISALDSTVGSTSVEANHHVAVKIIENDGRLSEVIVTEQNIASEDTLQEVSEAMLSQIDSADAIVVSEKINNKQTVGIKLANTQYKNTSTVYSNNIVLYVNKTFGIGINQATYENLSEEAKKDFIRKDINKYIVLAPLGESSYYTRITANNSIIDFETYINLYPSVQTVYTPFSEHLQDQSLNNALSIADDKGLFLSTVLDCGNY